MSRHPGMPTDEQQDSAAEAFFGVDDEDFRSAVRTILRGFDQGVFVRSTDHDHESAWAIKLFPYIRALAVAQRALAEPGSGLRVDPVDGNR